MSNKEPFFNHSEKMTSINEKIEQELFSAVETGNFEAVKKITATLPELILKKWPKGLNLVCTALRHKRKKIAELLIQLGFEIFYAPHMTLHLAVTTGDIDIIKLILEKSWIPIEVQWATLFDLIAQRIPFDEEFSRIVDYFLDTGVRINLQHKPTGFALIHFAAKYGNADLVRLILKRKSFYNLRTSEGLTPIHLAAMYGHSEVVLILLQRGVVFNLPDKRGRTPLCLAVASGEVTTIEILLYRILRNRQRIRPLTIKDDPLVVYYAVLSGNKTIVELLLNKGAVINTYSPETGKTALHLAVERESEEIVELLLKQGADSNAVQIQVPVSLENPTSSPGYSALHIACEKGHERIVNLLLEYNALPAVVDESGLTPLHLGVQSGSMPIITSLVSRCNLYSVFTAVGEKGYTPIHIATEGGYEEMVKFFLEQGISANTPAKNGCLPIHLAAQKGHKEILLLLLKYGADATIVRETVFESPFFFAAQIGSVEIIEILCQHFVKTSTWTHFYPALYVASYHGHENVVSFLLQVGTEAICPFENYLSPLYIAAQEGHFKITELLIKYGAKDTPTPTTASFSSPLLAATENGHTQIVEMLLFHGADVNARFCSPQERSLGIENLFTQGYYPDSESIIKKRFKTGYTLLHFGVESGKKEIVELLLKYQANVDAKSNFNLTPLGIATELKHEEIVESLLKAGADPNLQSNNLPEIRDDSNNNIGNQDFPLHSAIDRGDEKIVIKLIKYGACINCACDKGLTPLCHSVEKSNVDILIRLLKKGAQINWKILEGKSLLDFALEKKTDLLTIKLLLQCGVWINENKNFPILFRILYRKAESYRSRNSLLKLILDYGVDVNAWHSWSDVDGETALHFAARNGKASAVDLLLNYGADVNLMNSKGNTPLKIVVENYNEINYNYYRRGIDAFASFNDAKRYHEIALAITEVLGIEEARNSREINEQNRNLISENSLVKFHYLQCKMEIERMKGVKITKSLSCFDLLVANEIKLTNWAESQTDADEDSNYREEFPIYGKVLKNRVIEIKGGRKLMDKSVEPFKRIFRVEVPKPIVLKVLEYLSLVDLKNICFAGNSINLDNFQRR